MSVQILKKATSANNHFRIFCPQCCRYCQEEHWFSVVSLLCNHVSVCEWATVLCLSNVQSDQKNWALWAKCVCAWYKWACLYHWCTMYHPDHIPLTMSAVVWNISSHCNKGDPSVQMNALLKTCHRPEGTLLISAMNLQRPYLYQTYCFICVILRAGASSRPHETSHTL